MTTTREYARYFAAEYGRPIDEYLIVPNAVHNAWLEQVKVDKHREDECGKRKIKVIYWGLFLFQHGLDVAIEAADILKNDGFGTNLPVTSFSLVLSVLPSAGTNALLNTRDIIPPEDFVPHLVRNSDVFSNRYFLVFQTIDKQSGIDHYEVSELSTGGRFATILYEWHRAESPYELRDQALSSDIHVRAVDRSGNFIVVKLPARSPITPPQRSLDSFLNLIVFLLTILVLLYIVKRSLRK